MLGASRNVVRTRESRADAKSIEISTESSSAGALKRLWRANCHARPPTQNTTASTVYTVAPVLRHDKDCDNVDVDNVPRSALLSGGIMVCAGSC